MLMLTKSFLNNTFNLLDLRKLLWHVTSDAKNSADSAQKVEH
jgi:hypothetical protein